MFNRLQGFKAELEKIAIRINPKYLALGGGGVLGALGLAKLEKKHVGKVKDKALQQGYELGREHEQYLEQQGW